MNTQTTTPWFNSNRNRRFDSWFDLNENFQFADPYCKWLASRPLCMCNSTERHSQSENVSSLAIFVWMPWKPQQIFTGLQELARWYSQKHTSSQPRLVETGIYSHVFRIVATNLINKMGKSHPKTSITLCKTAGFSFIKAILDCITIIIIIILIIIITHAHGSHVSIVIICLCDSLCLV